jgi:hypothetical protein
MSDISRDDPDLPKNNMHKWMEFAIPLFSFGGAFMAILFQIQGISLDFRIPAFGCVLASCFLAYLAWIRPKKDIVALTTPIYSFIFFIVPTDYSTGIVLQLLYAVSLTILLVRLKVRFGTPGTAVSLGKELGGSLKTYIEQTRDSFRNTSPEAAHAAAVVFIRFAEGNYGEAEQSSKTALIEGETSGQTSTLMRALGIIREHSMLLNKSLPRPVTYLTFLERDFPVLAKPAAPANDADTEFYTVLDNALLVVFSADWNNSDRDRPYLLACQVFAQRLMAH